MKRKITIVLILAVSLMFTVFPRIANAAGVELVHNLNFGGTDLFRSTWNRLEVTVLNDSSDDLQGSVVVRAGGDFLQDVFVEAGKKASVVFYLPPAEVMESLSNSVDGFEISVRNTRGRELDSARISAASYGPQSAYVGVLGSGSGSTSRLTNVLPNTEDVKIAPAYLDNLLFAQNFSVIIVNDPEPLTLTAVQEENLRRWVEQGGILVLGGGSGWQRTADLIPADMLPLQPHGVQAIPGTDLAVLQLPVSPSGTDYTVATGNLLGTVLLEAGSTPILVRKNLGEGAVLWSALDLDAAPLDNPANNEAFWAQTFLRQPALSKPFPQQQPWAINQIFNTLSQDSLASALSPFRILLLLLVYIILAGPVNWLILRRLDRREWAWLTIPVLALLFTTGAFAAGRIGRGTERVLYQLNMVNVHSENLGSVQSYGGVFVPRRGRISLTAPVSGWAPLGEGVVTGTQGQSSMDFVNPPLWSVQRFYAMDFAELPGNFTLTAQPTGSHGGKLSAEVVNNSGQELFDSYIRMGKQWYQVGPLQAGEEKTLSASAVPMLDLGVILQRYSNNSRPWFEFNELLPGTAVFVGFSDKGLVPISGAGKTVALDIWVQSMDLDSVNFSPGSVDIPPGMVTPVLTGGTPINKWGGEYTFDGQGSCDLVFTFPTGLDYTQGEFLLNFYNIWGEARGTLEVYNHNREEWQELASLDSIFKFPGPILLVNPGELVRDNRLVARIMYDGHFGMSLQGMDITVEGGRIND